MFSAVQQTQWNKHMGNLIGSLKLHAGEAF